jgi:DNA-binding MarR family transcriptional regulator
MQVQLRMNYELNRQLVKDSGLSLADCEVLLALSSRPCGVMQISDLAVAIGWERSRVSHQLRRMCERGLTGRRPSSSDRRATDAMLTDEGRRVISCAAPAHIDLVRQLFFEPLSDDLLSSLTSALEHILVNLRRNGSDATFPQ